MLQLAIPVYIVLLHVHNCRICSIIVSHACEAPPTWCCHDSWCPSPLSARAILTTPFPPSTMVHSAGKVLVLQSGYVWLQPGSCPEVQDTCPAHQGVCGESSSPHSGKSATFPRMDEYVWDFEMLGGRWRASLSHSTKYHVCAPVRLSASTSTSFKLYTS